MRRLLLAGAIIVAAQIVRVGDDLGLLHAGSPAFAKEGGEGAAVVAAVTVEKAAAAAVAGEAGAVAAATVAGEAGAAAAEMTAAAMSGGSGDERRRRQQRGKRGQRRRQRRRRASEDADVGRGVFGGLFGGLFGGGGGERGGRDREFRRGEIIGYGLTAEQSNALAREGFRPIGDYRLAALGQTVTRMRVPLGLSAREGLATAEALAPGATLELNDLYASEGSACAAEACWPAELVGFDHVDGNACAGAPPIAIVDTAIERRHPALAGARIVSQSFADGAGTAPAGHATAISALLVGRPGNGAGPLVPGGELLVAEAFAREEEGERADAVAVLRGLDWAVASGAKIVGLSLAGAANRALERGIEAAARQATLVAAGGNGGPNGAPAYPAAYPEVIAVAAVDARRRPYRRGTRGAYIDISAPGVQVVSADAGGGTTAWTGTSFSVPFVMAALMRARAETGGDPAAAWSLVSRDALDLGAPGRDEVYGLGLVQSPGESCR